MRAKQGVTLIELLIFIAIAIVVLTIGVPAFRDIMRNNRLAALSNTFIAALHLARSEAIKRGKRVTVRKTALRWEQGWQVFTDDVNGNGQYGIIDGGDETLRVYPALTEGYTLRGNKKFTSYITFKETGESNTMGSFALCDNSDNNFLPEANTARLIIVNAVGRVRQGIDSNGNGIPEKDDGTDLDSCASP